MTFPIQMLPANAPVNQPGIEWFNYISSVLNNLNGVNCEIERNGEEWLIVVGEGANSEGVPAHSSDSENKALISAGIDDPVWQFVRPENVGTLDDTDIIAFGHGVDADFYDALIPLATNTGEPYGTPYFAEFTASELLGECIPSLGGSKSPGMVLHMADDSTDYAEWVSHRYALGEVAPVSGVAKADGLVMTLRLQGASWIAEWDEGGGNISGTGTANQFAMWTDASTLEAKSFDDAIGNCSEEFLPQVIGNKLVDGLRKSRVPYHASADASGVTDKIPVFSESNNYSFMAQSVAEIMKRVGDFRDGAGQPLTLGWPRYLRWTNQDTTGDHFEWEDLCDGDQNGTDAAWNNCLAYWYINGNEIRLKSTTFNIDDLSTRTLPDGGISNKALWWEASQQEWVAITHNDGFNKSFGSGSDNVARGNHSHGVFTDSPGFAPGASGFSGIRYLGSDGGWHDLNVVDAWSKGITGNGGGVAYKSNSDSNAISISLDKKVDLLLQYVSAAPTSFTIPKLNGYGLSPGLTLKQYGDTRIDGQAGDNYMPTCGYVEKHFLKWPIPAGSTYYPKQVIQWDGSKMVLDYVRAH